MTDWDRRSLTLTGGRILPERGDPGAPRCRRLAIFVHGFNNDREQALANYEATVKNMVGIVPAQRLADEVWGLFWPGYVEALRRQLQRNAHPYLRTEVRPVSESNTPITAVLYSKQIPKARDAGTILGEYILGLTDGDSIPSQVLLLGHSLGCRVILEAVKRISREGPQQAARLPVICLMAAAVPTYMFGYLEEFWWTAHFPRRTYVLYSREDSVLRIFFPPGQTLVGEGWWPEAVGRNGSPDIWNARDNTMLGHGEYWGARATRPHVARFFGEVTREVLPTQFEPVAWKLPSPVKAKEWAIRRSTLPRRGFGK